MRTTLHNLISSFAERHGCACQTQSGTCQASILVGGLQIQLGLFEQSGMLLLHTGVGLLPMEGREELLRTVLAANNLFAATNGCTLGLDPDQGLITLQLAWNLHLLDDTSFDTLMDNFLTIAAQWLQELNGWLPGEPASGTSAQTLQAPPLPSFSLRV